MTERTFQLRRMTLQMGAATLLAACGGGSGPAPAPTPTPTPTPPPVPPAPAPVPELRLIAGAHGSIGRADGAGPNARFNRISDAKIDSKGTIYVIEPRSAASGADYISGYAVRSVERDGMVRTVYANPFKDDLPSFYSLWPTRLFIDTSDQVFITRLSQTLVLGKDGTALPLPDGKRVGNTVTSAAGIRYRFTWEEIYRIEADGSNTLLAGCENLIPAPDLQTPLIPCPTQGPAGAARFGYIRPDTVVLDPAGNLYLADKASIRKVTPQGVVSTLAGVAPEGTSRPPARDGSGAAARFVDPAHMVYHDGQLLVIDDFVLRRVSLDGAVTTSALALPDARALLTDRAGKVYVVFSQHISLLGPGDTLSLFAGAPNLSEKPVDGTGAAARLRSPQGLAATPSGTLYAIERPMLSHNIYGEVPVSGINLRKIAPDGSVSSQFRAAGIPTGIAADKAGNIYISTLASSISDPSHPSAGADILKLGTNGEWSIFAGTRPGSMFADLTSPYLLGFDKEGDLYINDGHKVLKKVTPQGQVFPATSVPPEVGAAFDELGNRYVTDAAANTVTRITPAGVSTVVAGKAGPALAVPGAAPVTLDNPRGIVRIGANSYALISGNAIVKLTLP